jgi:hypothetical protein
MSSQVLPNRLWPAAERWAVMGLLLFTLMVRGGALFALCDKLADDPDAYREIAENVLRHGVFGLGKDGQPTPTAYRPPLYPFVLSNLPAADGVRVSLAKVAALHLLLGIGTVLLTYLTARRLYANRAGSPGLRWAPLLAGLLVACDSILLNQQALVMTETLAAFLAILSLWLLARFDAKRDWFSAGLAGGAIGLAALCRPTFLPWLGLVALGMLLVRSGNCGLKIADCGLAERYGGFWWGFGWRVANDVALVVVAAGVMSPWAIRNQREFGRPIVTTTHGGYTLALGNNEYFYRWLDESVDGTPWDSANFDRRLRTELYWGPLHHGHVLDEERVLDRNFYYERAKRAIRENPRMFLLAALYRVRQLWSPLPYKLSADESTGRMLLRYATAAWYCGVYALAAVGAWKLRWQLIRPPWVWGVLLCLTFTAVHTLYWCNLRMRAPLMPLVAIVAGAALVGPAPRSPVNSPAPAA